MTFTSPSRQPGRKRRPRPLLTRNNLDACRVRKPGTGNERVPPLRPLNGLNAGLASGGRPAAESAGFSRVLRPDEQRYHRAGPAVLQLPGHAVAAAAVQARAGPAAHKAGASMPGRPPLGRSAGQGGGRHRARVTQNHTQQTGGNHGRRPSGKNLEEMIEQMFKVARRALQSSNATPEQRSVSRTLLQRRDDLAEAPGAYGPNKPGRTPGWPRRRAVADANTFPVPTDLRSTLLRKVGRPTAKDRAAQAMQEQRQQARIQDSRLARCANRLKKPQTRPGGVRAGNGGFPDAVSTVPAGQAGSTSHRRGTCPQRRRPGPSRATTGPVSPPPRRRGLEEGSDGLARCSGDSWASASTASAVASSSATRRPSGPATPRPASQAIQVDAPGLALVTVDPVGGHVLFKPHEQPQRPLAGHVA